jgi:hypothetical protein
MVSLMGSGGEMNGLEVRISGSARDLKQSLSDAASDVLELK